VMRSKKYIHRHEIRNQSIYIYILPLACHQNRGAVVGGVAVLRGYKKLHRTGTTISRFILSRTSFLLPYQVPDTGTW
jgi:hypothetical protein